LTRGYITERLFSLVLEHSTLVVDTLECDNFAGCQEGDKKWEAKIELDLSKDSCVRTGRIFSLV
jgi:hypothetical protein